MPYAMQITPAATATAATAHFALPMDITKHAHREQEADLPRLYSSKQSCVALTPWELW